MQQPEKRKDSSRGSLARHAMSLPAACRYLVDHSSPSQMFHLVAKKGNNFAWISRCHAKCVAQMAQGKSHKPSQEHSIEDCNETSSIKVQNCRQWQMGQLEAVMAYQDVFQ